MESESELARNSVGVSDEDVGNIRRTARRQRLVMTLAGGMGTVAALIAGFLTARHIYYDPPSTSGSDSYPFIPPLIAVGAAGGRRRLGPLGILGVICAAFMIMFILSAAAYSMVSGFGTMYSVWSSD